ncbi:MAG: DUF4372 domain-containing protein [Phycisphaerales bacterium]|nr:DUF4372 domain-containing protein [Phycisphaerales bacterium]
MSEVNFTIRVAIVPSFLNFAATKETTLIGAKVAIMPEQPIFTQMLSLIDDRLIQAACKQHDADKFPKKLSFKDHLTTLLY